MSRRRERDTYHHGQLRDELIDQAEALIAESGAQAWSMREAARRLGVSQAAPYRHFADKDALIDAVVVRGYVKLEQRYEDELSKRPAEADPLIVIALAYFEFGVAEAELFSLMFSSPRLHSTGEALHSYRTFEAEVANAQSRGDLPTGSTRDQAHALWSAAHGVTELVNRRVFGPRHGRKVAKLCITSTVAGLRNDRG